MKDQIEQWLQCDNEEDFSFVVKPLREVEKDLEALGYFHQDGNINGADADFSYYFYNQQEDRTILLSGSVWNGGYFLDKTI